MINKHTKLQKSLAFPGALLRVTCLLRQGKPSTWHVVEKPKQRLAVHIEIQRIC